MRITRLQYMLVIDLMSAIVTRKKIVPKYSSNIIKYSLNLYSNLRGSTIVLSTFIHDI